MTPTFINGDLVIYTDTNSGLSAEGIVLAYTAEDQYVVLVKDPDDDWDIVRAETNEVAPNQAVEPLTFPGSASFTPDNIFVVECATDDGPSYELFATPSAVEVAHPEFDGLRVLLMEAIADPGEKFEMGTYFVSFRSVQGDIKS